MVRSVCLLTGVAWLLWGCGEDPATCDHSTGQPRYELDSPNPASKGEALLLTGSVVSDVRILSFKIGGASVEGSDNYSTWKVTIPATALAQNREKTQSSLAVTMNDACGVLLDDFEPVVVDFEAPKGTQAKGLAVELRVPDNDCYLPADGSSIGEVVVTADQESAGVRVTLSSSVGELLGVQPDDKTLLLTELDDRAGATAVVRDSSAQSGRLSITAAAGSTFAISDPVIRVAAAPTFTTGDVVLNGEVLARTVSTDGRLAWCAAQSSVEDAVVEFAFPGQPGKDVLNADPVELNQRMCEQSARFEVRFPVGTTKGAVIELLCADTYNQQILVSVASAGDPADGT